MSVLLLNASFEPLRVISAKRAVVLVLSEKAEVIEEGTGRFRSESTEIVVPSIIRLSHFVQIPFRAKVPLTRKTLLARDRHQCQVSDCPRIGSTIDHVHPRSKGGKHDWVNVAAMCARCNATKADKTLDELGWTLKRKPVQPSGTKWLLIGINAEPLPSWEPYLVG